jgi:hypothetical protein
MSDFRVITRDEMPVAMRRRWIVERSIKALADGREAVLIPHDVGKAKTITEYAYRMAHRLQVAVEIGESPNGVIVRRTLVPMGVRRNRPKFEKSRC